MPLAEAKCSGSRQSGWAVRWRASHVSLCCQGLQGWGRKRRAQTWLKGTGGAPEATPQKLVKEECGENGSLQVLQCSGQVLSPPLYCCHPPPPFLEGLSGARDAFMHPQQGKIKILRGQWPLFLYRISLAQSPWAVLPLLYHLGTWKASRGIELHFVPLTGLGELKSFFWGCTAH